MKITQAVIFAGGKGERLSPLTKQVPKPLISINGQPFIVYLFDRLAEQGIKEIKVLTGYLGNKFLELSIPKYSGTEITFHQTPEDFQTGDRIQEVKHELDPHFFCMYGDNYWPFNLQSLSEKYEKNGTLGQIVCYENSDAYSSSNISLSGSKVVYYDVDRRGDKKTTHVDIGFGIFNAEALSGIDWRGAGFEKKIYPELISRCELSAEATKHRYYTLTNLARMAPLRKVLTRNIKYILIDRDGVLNRCPEKSTYVKNFSEWNWLQGGLDLLRFLKKKQVRAIILTNQAGLSRGMINQTDLDLIHENMIQDLQARGLDNVIEDIYFCPHHWDDKCSCRKPEPGMFFQAQKDHSLDLSRLVFIGDSDSDAQAANNAGVNFIRVNDIHGDYFPSIAEELEKHY